MTHILVVEDDESVLALLLEIVDEEGYSAIGAVNGREALRMVNITCPDLIITDITMPEMDGLTMCAHLQADPSTAVIPIIVCSAGHNKPSVSQCAYHAFLAKPFDITTVLNTIEMVLAS